MNEPISGEVDEEVDGEVDGEAAASDGLVGGSRELGLLSHRSMLQYSHRTVGSVV